METCPQRKVPKEKLDGLLLRFPGFRNRLVSRFPLLTAHFMVGWHAYNVVGARILQNQSIIHSLRIGLRFLRLPCGLFLSFCMSTGPVESALSFGVDHVFSSVES